jgi:hypothetical protein
MSSSRAAAATRLEQRAAGRRHAYGFAVEQARSLWRLALAGRHRFSRYRLVFELEEAGRDRTRIRARTWAAFPGAPGRVYQALVIGTGAHRIVVRHLLRRIARRACSA